MTYEIKNKASFLELASTGEQQEVITFLNDAIANDMLVSIQASLVNGEEVYLYGMYDNTAEWVANYNSNGGMWQYSNPAELLAEFTSVENKFFTVSNFSNVWELPEFFYGNFDHLQETIKKARQALIISNADTMVFNYRGEFFNGEPILLNSEDITDEYSFDDTTWGFPQLEVSINDTKIRWIDDNSKDESMWIVIERNY